MKKILSILLLILQLFVFNTFIYSGEISGVSNISGLEIKTFSPIQIEGIGLWLDSSDISTITPNGSKASQWNDKSGNNVNAAQTSASLQPVSGASTQNGLNLIDFEDFHHFDISYTYGTELTLFFVSTVSTRNQSYVLASDDSGGSPAIINKYNPGDGIKAIEWFNGADRDTLLETGEGFQVISIKQKDGDVVSGYHNGTEVFNKSSLVNIDGDSLIKIGVSAASANKYVGSIGEIIFYNRILTEVESEKVFTYLNSKWNVY